jgi:Tfp pilus assembly PilM family ATPase
MRNVLAVEIGQQNIKIAASLAPSRSSLKNLYFSSKTIASLEDEAISKLITEVLNKWKFKPSYVVLSLPRNLVAVRNLSLPSKDKDEISKMVDLHAVKVVPYKKEEMVTAYSALEQTEAGYSQVLLSAVHRNTLNRHLKIITDAGFLADKVYLSSCGIREYVLAMRKNVIEKEGIYIAVDLDAEYCDFTAFSKEKLLFTRSIIIGAAQLENEEERARLIKEIKQTVIIFKSELENKKPQKIFITGATGLLKSYEEAMAQQLELPLEIIAADEEIAQSDKIEVTRNISLTSINQLLSEAPERISFFVAELQVSRVFKERVTNLIIAGSLGVFILFIISCIFLANVYNKQVYLHNINNQAKKVEQEVQGLAGESELVETAKAVVKRKRLPLVFFLELYKLVPKEIAIKSIEVDNDDIVFIRGESLNLSDVYAFSEKLDKSKHFVDINNKSARKKKARKGELTDFEITANFRY